MSSRRVIVVVYFMVACLVLLVACFEYEYSLKHQGEVSDVEYISGSFSTNPKTIITFNDGRRVVMNGHYDVPPECARIETCVSGCKRGWGKVIPCKAEEGF